MVLDLDDLVGLEERLQQCPRDVVGANLRRLRHHRGFVLVELSEMTRIQPATLSRIERGLRPLRQTHAVRLIRALDIQPGALVEEVDRA